MDKEPTGAPASKDKNSEGEGEQFYETLQQSIKYTPIEDPRHFEDIADKDDFAANDAKLTAVITIVLTVLVALVMGVLFLRGLNAVNSAVPTQTTSTNSQGY
jgi:hypothetical protein